MQQHATEVVKFYNKLAICRSLSAFFVINDTSILHLTGGPRCLQDRVMWPVALKGCPSLNVIDRIPLALVVVLVVVVVVRDTGL